MRAFALALGFWVLIGVCIYVAAKLIFKYVWD
jgi:hypothetical protein